MKIQIMIFISGVERGRGANHPERHQRSDTKRKKVIQKYLEKKYIFMVWKAKKCWEFSQDKRIFWGVAITAVGDTD